jgi:hypothetical protein
MKISMHQPNKNGEIRINNVIRLLTMGIKKNVVSIWAVTDPLEVSGLPTIPMVLLVKEDGAPVTKSECNRYITSFINKDGTWHLFGAEQKVTPAHIQGLPNSPGGGPGGPTQAPDGRLIK